MDGPGESRTAGGLSVGQQTDRAVGDVFVAVETQTSHTTAGGWQAVVQALVEGGVEKLQELHTSAEAVRQLQTLGPLQIAAQLLQPSDGQRVPAVG